MKFHSIADADVALQVPGYRAAGNDLAKGQGLEVFVVYTNEPGTLAALKLANQLAAKLEARFHLLMPYEVPYSLSLDHPAVRVEFLERELQAVAGQASMDIVARVVLCRDKLRVLQAVMRAGSLVIVGGRRRWWPTPERKLVRALKRDGFRVFFAELNVADGAANFKRRAYAGRGRRSFWTSFTS